MPVVDYRMPGGISFEELTEVLQVLMNSPKAIGLEVTIFNLSLDPEGAIAANLNQCLVSGLTLGKS